MKLKIKEVPPAFMKVLKAEALKRGVKPSALVKIWLYDRIANALIAELEKSEK